MPRIRLRTCFRANEIHATIGAAAFSPAAWHSASVSNLAVVTAPAAWPETEETYNSKTNALFIGHGLRKFRVSLE